MENFKLIYTATGNDVKSRDGFTYTYSNKEDAEKAAIDFSLAEHDKNPEEVDEEGKIFIMDWLGFNKPYYGDESKFVQYVTVEEVEDEDEIEED
jgi:hypothetical protein